MGLFRQLTQPAACTAGFHDMPASRLPPGPIVATCPCCRRVVYYYGLTAQGVGAYPSLLVPNFPRIVGTTAIPDDDKTIRIEG